MVYVMSMSVWTTLLKTIKLCVCLILLSMLVLLHYTLRQHDDLAYMAVRGDDRLSSGASQQWRMADRRPHRVLASSQPERTTIWELASSQPERTTIWEPASSQPERTTVWEPASSQPERTTVWEPASSQPERTTIWEPASSQPERTTVWEPASSQPERTTERQTVISVTSDDPTYHQRPKPLPQFHIESILQPNNDTVFLSQVSDNPPDKPITPLSNSRHSNWLARKLHLPSDEVLSPRRPGGGYVVVLKVYEQQTMASGNLLQLQCWASMVNMSLVTPFMKLSFIVTPLDEMRQRTHLSLWDTFSRTHWQAHTEAHGYLPMVGWEEWIRQAPRKVIIVQFKHPVLSRVKEMQQHGITFPHPHSGNTFDRGCEFRFISGKVVQAFLKAKGFIIVRKVCFNFQYGDGFTFAEFQEHLFGPLQPGDVSVIFDMWRGLHEPQRVLITDKICREQHPFREQVRPSTRLLQDAQRYRDKFLGPDDYIAVITRFEMTGLSRQHELDNDTHAEIPRCISKTLAQLNQLRTDTGIEHTFLSIDIGKYGSSSFAKKRYYNHLPDMIGFVHKVYGGRMALVDIEHTLEHVSGTNDSGYIASLQQLIVTKAMCILFMGGGSFQRHALHMYQELHPNTQEQCIHVVESCTNPNRPIR